MCLLGCDGTATCWVATCATNAQVPCWVQLALPIASVTSSTHTGQVHAQGTCGMQAGTGSLGHLAKVTLQLLDGAEVRLATWDGG